MSKTISFVNIDDVLSHIGINQDDHPYIYDAGFGGVSFGDASYTMVGNKFALACITDGVESLQLDDKYLDLTREMIEQRYWEIVGKDDYINLEA